MSPAKRDAQPHATVRQRRRRTAAERLQRDHDQAQRVAKVLAQALHDLGLPDDLMAEIEVVSSVNSICWARREEFLCLRTARRGQVKGHDLQQHCDWPWRHRPQVLGVHYARLRATSPTYGVVPLIIIAESREEQCYVMCLDTAISGPRLIRA
jgi:hypothetical protein